jgi:hypothetical protein
MATKLSFIYEGVSYKDIDAKLNSSSSRDYYRINEVGTAQMIRQWIKKNYPAVPLRGFYTVKSNSFANGNSVDVTLTNPPLHVRNYIYEYLTDNFEYYQQHLGFGQYKQKKSVVYPKTDDGKDIEFGAKFISVEATNVDPNDTATQVLWVKSAGAKKQLSIKKGTSTSPNNEAKKQGYPIGQIIMECAGWDIGKKTLPDGRVVYNARIKANTQPNKTDWTTIKNEIYINTGFKWGKFNAFEKWGQISNESFTINKLCEILNKYYKDESPAAPQPTPQTQTQSPSVPTPSVASTQKLGGDIPAMIIGLTINIKGIPFTTTYDSREKIVNETGIWGAANKWMRNIETRSGVYDVTKLKKNDWYIDIVIVWENYEMGELRMTGETYLMLGFQKTSSIPFNEFAYDTKNQFFTNKLQKDIDELSFSDTPALVVPTPTPNQPTKQEILLAIESMKLLAKYGNKDAEQAIKTFETLLKYQP